MILLLSFCARPQQEEQASGENLKREYREIKPEILTISEELRSALPGLLNDNLYLYREISPSLQLVAYVPDYSLSGAVNIAAKAFTIMTKAPDYRKGMEFWIIQIQPEPENGDSVLVWGVRPEEADRYVNSSNLEAFFTQSEYVLIDDKIIPPGDERARAFSFKQAPAKTGLE